MNSYLSKRWIVIIFLLFVSNSNGQEKKILFSSSEIQDISDSIYVLEDPSGKLTIEDVIASEEFTYNTHKVPNLGITKSTFWIKFRLKNNSSSNKLLLELSYPIIDTLHFYHLNPDGSIEIVKTGESKPFKERKYNHQHFIFDLNLYPQEEATYFLRINSGEEILLPLIVGAIQPIFEDLVMRDLLSGIYFGIIFVMFFYNLFLFFTVKDPAYFFYVIYIIIVGMVQACFQGYTFRYLWPNSPWIAIHSIYLISALSGVFGMEFLRRFLKTKEYVPKLANGIIILHFSYLVVIILCFYGIYNISFKLLNITAMAVAIYMLIIAFIVYRKGYKPAKFFLVGWSFFLIGVCIFGLRNFGLLPYNNFTYYVLQIGSAFEVVLLSLALGDKINTFKKEKEDSQKRELIALQETETLIKQQNIVLEEKVNARTFELSKSNEELAIAIKDLKEAQTHLVQSEKMASLGQLTAGVAHEINNPINFVTSSISPLKRDINDLLSVLEEYNNLSLENFEKKIQQINKLKSNLDLPYVKEEIDSLLKGIEEGATRTSEIVKGLRTFSRVDEADLKEVDIHDGIDSTLILLTSIIRDKITIIKNYGEIPPIECFAGKMNQVFMNILTNSIHAISDNKNDENGIIELTTKELNNYIVISIKDNGGGIPDHIKSKIFEPFFTTKDIGEGTGLGLSIVYNIIKSHHGDIKVISEPGKGTEFIISLPKSQKVSLT